MSTPAHSPQHWPKVSCIIPTLNAGQILGNCLQSIRRQDYPPEKIEILVADGGSTDNTLDLVREYRCLLVRNPLRVAESGKHAALEVATGEFIVFLDADNELTSVDFIRLAVRALEAHPEALGLESYYLRSPRMGSFCAYLTQTLHIGDPVSWMMTVNPVFLGRTGEVERWGFPEGSLAYPLGANGFVYRRTTLDLGHPKQADPVNPTTPPLGPPASLPGSAPARPENIYEDTQVALRIAMTGRTTWLRLTGRGVHHYLVGGLADFIRKRRRQAFHYQSLRDRPQSVTWTQMRPAVPAWLAAFYCVSIVGPLWHTTRGICRTGDWRWLWHPVACVCSVLGLAWGLATFRFGPRTPEAEASLQPKQRIG